MSTATTELQTFAMFAVARFLVINGGHTDQIADHIGLSVPYVQQALEALGSHVERTPLGWEATDDALLINWAIHGYPSPTGVTSYWAIETDLNRAALRLQVEGLSLSDTWAANRYDPQLPADRVTAYAGTVVDLTGAGFTRSTPGPNAITVIVPDDSTILPSARWNIPAGCTDTFITASTILSHPVKTVSDRATVHALQKALNHQSERRRTSRKQRWT